MAILAKQFRGCLLGAAIGDMIGAAVEAESPAYIAKTFRSIDDILATPSVEEFSGPDWRIGRCTDDTQMTMAVAEWLLQPEPHTPQRLLAIFADAYEPWRRYGPGTETILRMFPQHREQWRELATAQFPHGSYGNGSAMRAAPIGLAYSSNLDKAAAVAIESSRPTHSHPLAFQGAVLQATAVAMAVAKRDPTTFADALRSRLRYFTDLMQDTSPLTRALDAIEHALASGASCSELSGILGTGVTAQEAVPMALYCFLRHPDSFADVIHNAVFIGGDTDTIACMAGAISGAYLGVGAIPASWRLGLRDERYSPEAITLIADRLMTTFAHGV